MAGGYIVFWEVVTPKSRFVTTSRVVTSPPLARGGYAKFGNAFNAVTTVTTYPSLFLTFYRMYIIGKFENHRYGGYRWIRAGLGAIAP